MEKYLKILQSEIGDKDITKSRLEIIKETVKYFQNIIKTRERDKERAKECAKKNK
jgi:hypothetical protein